jgi:two-component system, OmpR family, sensor kinase
VSHTQPQGSDLGHMASPDIHIRRQDEWVKISLELGPDASATAEMERRWLSRMAVRHGGRCELEGATQSVLLPADGAAEQREVFELRRELVQAQQLGEAYARELAAAFSANEAGQATPAPETEHGPQPLELLHAAASAIAKPLRDWLEAARADATLATSELGENSQLSRNLERRVSTGYELLVEVSRVADVSLQEKPRVIDLSALVQDAIDSAEPRAARHHVTLDRNIHLGLTLHTQPSALSLLVRALVDHAISASPRDEAVRITLTASTQEAELRVEDAGPTVPHSSREALLANQIDPAAFGRPTGIALLSASAAASFLRCKLALRDSGSGRVEMWAQLKPLS